MPALFRAQEERRFSADTGQGLVYKGIIKNATFTQGYTFDGSWASMEEEVKRTDIDMECIVTHIELDAEVLRKHEDADERMQNFINAIEAIYPQVIIEIINL